ncbi:hypothetical protein [Geothrix sp. PMB-07]|uniref:hypothetical protein n=1 Tax=Geothrix sp. PMB-07 TaxID=3068640 RepID=UPI00274182ED|nr:hypothetical protein [Geothrix sp. PMB-07]WLT30997.1 hypothetical protein Q9293_14865 [Geothrix sp. PMB-07]
MITSFIASPATIAPGASSSLSWNVTGATSLGIDHGAPATSGASGSVAVSPAATTLYTLTATNESGSTTATATVTVGAPGVTVSVTPPSARVKPSGTQAFTAVVTGTTTTTAVTWQVQEANGGAVNASGLYTAPATNGVYHLKATSVADTSKSATATITVSDSAVAGSLAAGSVPTQLPARLSVGLVEDPGKTWMKASGVPWDMRYHYFTLGWRNNWNNDPTNSGQWGLNFMKECDAMGAIPVVQYYCMNDEPGGGEGQFYSKTQNAATMASYFDDFKVLMQRCKEFGKPVLVLMEGDGYAYMEIQSGGNPDAPAAIASTGMPELKDLPNTAAGWGLAFLQLRKAVGATNVVLGMHISAWATLQDISYFSVTLPLQPEVDKAYAFLSKLGLAANVTGQTFDVLVGDPLDRDSDYYRLTAGEDRWWDASDSAPITSKSFNRYAEWLRLWNLKAQKRWVLWQIPLGNSNHLNVPNTWKDREGYKDNRPEYFFAGDDAHLRKFADAGVIALLFGAGADGQSMYQNDTYTDGQPFMKTHAGAFLKSGGLAIAR